MSESTEHKDLEEPAGVLNPLNSDGSLVHDSKDDATASGSSLLHRNIHAPPRYVTSTLGSFITLDNGQVILDATGGAAVACLGHGHKRIVEAMKRQADQVAYCHSIFFSTQAAEDLAKELCNGTDGHMKRAFIVSSGERPASFYIPFVDASFWAD